MPSSPSAPAQPQEVTAEPTDVDTGEDESLSFSIASLTLDTPLIPFIRKDRRVPASPFHFLSLPSELRLKIYKYFFEDVDSVLDLGPYNYKRVHSKLRLMRVCKQVHAEATHYFYSTRTFRLFPAEPGKYFYKKPLLTKLKPHQRECITSLQLRLGDGWTAPPKRWAVNEALGLKDCINVQKLDVFIQFDPSDNQFQQFRRYDGFYETFSCNLLTDVLKDMPKVKTVEFDGWPSVRKSGALMQGLIDVAIENERLLAWGPASGWSDEMDDDDTIDSGVDLTEDLSVSGFGQSSLLIAA